MSSDMIISFRTTFSLAQYQVAHLHQDMRERNLDALQYVRELLARRYEDLSRADEFGSANT